MPNLSLTITRDSLGLGNLVVTNDPTAPRWIPEDGIARPATVWERSTASSAYVHGDMQTSARMTSPQLQVVVYHHGADDADLDALTAETEAALYQESFTITLAIGARAPLTYRCNNADIDPGPLDSGMVAQHLERVVATVPVYPIPGA